ncbi:hypothetical protein EZ456_04075 [Pedobacter psychrodurus]|uniref:Uncharacterized protein n=1 Tax=Pedobacter psychrodurus TaxID=2530456 RepID=A0A4R0Q6T7_9SPHI|nr:hypothetical protein [Pedobacter psychrodurus]TCD28575.1 hypothetical protein EZ456_04075 [Pedobacter psychrodurus]
MKNFKTIMKMLIILGVFFTLSSCKKDKEEGEGAGTIAGKFDYQNSSNNINSGDYRGGNGDGAWLYFLTPEFNSVQIRFKNLGNYVIPIGSFTYKNGAPYNTATNFAGGAVTINNVTDEINGGSVVISKDGDKYNITFNATTAKGPLKGNYTGELKKI